MTENVKSRKSMKPYDDSDNFWIKNLHFYIPKNSLFSCDHFDGRSWSKVELQRRKNGKHPEKCGFLPKIIEVANLIFSP